MTTALYVPGTSETDPAKLIMSQQLVAGQTSTNTDNITTNTAAIAALNAATYVNSIAGNSGAFTLSTGLANTVNALRVSLSTASNILSGNVAMGAINNVVDGPSMAQGTAGTWIAIGGVTASDSVGVCQIDAKLWDGTTIISSGSFMVSSSATVPNSIVLCGVLASPAANIKISVKNASRSTGSLLFNSSGSSKDCWIFGIRIA